MDPNILPAQVESILLVRLSARGDVTFASAIIPCLRARFPKARIGWVVEEASHDLVAHHPELDEVIIFPRGRWKHLRAQGKLAQVIGEAAQWFGNLRDRRYQVALDLQGLLRSGIVAFLSGAPVRIGLGSKEGSRVLMTRTFPRDLGQIRRVSSEYHYLADVLGLQPGAFPMSVHLDPEDLAGADRLIEEQSLQAGFLALCPFTTRPQKHWTEDRWAELSRRLTRRTGLPTVFLGSPDDREAVDQIVGHGGYTGVDLVGKTRLGEAAGLVHRARGMVGVDTGLTHMSMALETPTVALFGSTTPYLDPPNPQTRIVYHPLHCSPCETRPTCGGEFTCMRSIEVEEVEAALMEVIGGGSLPS